MCFWIVLPITRFLTSICFLCSGDNTLMYNSSDFTTRNTMDNVSILYLFTFQKLNMTIFSCRECPIVCSNVPVISGYQDQRTRNDVILLINDLSSWPVNTSLIYYTVNCDYSIIILNGTYII